MTDLLLVSLGTTRGLRVADAAFADFARGGGASVETVATRIGLTGRLRRAYPVIDLVEAAAARRALSAGLAAHEPRAVVFSTTTAALLAPVEVPYAVRMDSPAALNRPGPRNAVLHALERRRLAGARVVLPWSAAAAAALPPGSARSVVVRVPVEASGERERDGAQLAVAYTPDPKAKGLDLLCSAWSEAGLPAARLAVFGIEPERGRAHLARHGVAEPHGIEWRGMAPAAEFRASLRSARALVVAARWEDFGQAQLEALADGALLVTAPAGGAYEALALARELDARLVSADHSSPSLGAAIRIALEMPEAEASAYTERATERLAPYRPEAIARVVAGEVLPVLLS